MHYRRYRSVFFLLCGLLFAITASAEPLTFNRQSAAGTIINMEISHASHLRSPCPVLEPEAGREHHVVFLFLNAKTRRAMQPEQATIRITDKGGKLLWEGKLEKLQAYGVTSYCQFIARDTGKSMLITVSFKGPNGKGQAAFEIPASA